MGHKPGTPPGSPDAPQHHILHSHGQAGEGAIAEEQVAGGEGADAKLLHELLLTAQHPPHCHVLVLQHVQCHLQVQRPQGQLGGRQDPSPTRGTAGLFCTPCNTLHLQSSVQADGGGCWKRTSLPEAPRSYWALGTWASRETGDKCSCTHLSAHKGVALLEDQCQVLVLVPLEEGANFLCAAKEKRMAVGALASARCSTPPRPKGACPLSRGFGRGCWCRSSPTKWALPPC